MIGDPDSTEQLATEALEIGTKSGQPDAFTFYGTQLMIARFQQGRLGELVPLLADVVEENPGIPAYRAGLASAHLEAGDDDAARQLLEAASRDGFTLPPDSTWFDGLIGYCWVAVELGHEPAAGQLLELLATYKNQTPFSGVVPHTPVACYLGGLASLFGRFEEAETYFEIATNLNTAGNMRFAEAKTALLWGRMLATRGPRATWTGLGSCSRSPNRSPRRTVTVEFSVSSRRPAPCSELQWPRWDAHRTTLHWEHLHWGASPDRPPAWGPRSRTPPGRTGSRGRYCSHDVIHVDPEAGQ